MQLVAMRRGGERRVHVSCLLQHLGGDVARNVVVHEMLSVGRDLRGDDHRQRLVLNLHQLGGVLRDRARLRDDEHHRLTRVANALRSQASLRAAVGEVRVRDEDRQVLVAEGQVRGGVDGDHPGHSPGRAHVY